jgi:hypothetical protein
MDEDSTKEFRDQEKKIKWQITLFTWLVWIFIIIGVLSGAYGVYTFSCQSDFKLNVLGDYLGGTVASLWSLAGLFLIYIAFLGQKLQLIYQQQELIVNRKELQANRLETERQNETLSKQRFENTFFQLLRFHHEIVQSIDLYSIGAGKNTVGRSAFEHMYRELKYVYDSHPTRLSLSQEEVIRNVYKDFFKIFQPFVGHYFRDLYNIVKFIHLSGFSEEERKKYTNLIRAQLSSNELLLLFYNCLSDVGKPFHEWVEFYNLLKTTPNSELLDKDHVKFYPKTKFDLDHYI